MEEKLTLYAENLQVYYRESCALNIERLTANGSVIAIIGHNGSGKSTLIKTLLQLLIPTTGSMNSYIGQSMLHPLSPEKDMAYAPESGAVFADVSVENYIRLWCRIKQHDGNYYKKQGCQFIEELAITPLLSKLGRELSKGQRRRVQIAAGLMINPRFFLFDEPFDGLDVQQSGQLTGVIQKEARKRSMLVSTHRMDIVERICDTIIVLDNGKVTTSGSVDDVCKDLAERTLALDFLPKDIPQIKELSNLVRSTFPSILLTQIGSQLLLTGKNIDEPKIMALLKQCSLRPHNTTTTRCSLVDAMSYHLHTTNAM